MELLTKSSYRYIKQHPLQSVLSLIGIALGVCIVIAIDIANQAASKSFELSIKGVTGESTHQIIGNSGSLGDSVYKRLRVGYGLKNIAPVIQQYVRASDDGSRKLLLFGIDPFAERSIRPSLAQRISNSNKNFTSLITDSNSVILHMSTANEIGKAIGDTFLIRIGIRSFAMKIAGLIGDTLGNDVQFKDLIICDIYNAQRILGLQGQLSSIDIRIDEDNNQLNNNKSSENQSQLAADSLLNEIRAILPVDLELISAKTKSNTADEMLSAFNKNLFAMSLLALIVGMFLIFNTMTFSVVQRRNYIGLMRSIGITKSEVFAMILTESLIFGIAGTLLGLLLGIVLGFGLVKVITQSINDLYFVLNVNQTEIDPITILKGVGLGISATFIATLYPAFEAANSRPRVALIRSHIETGLKRLSGKFALFGLIIIIIGIFVLLIPSKDILFSYAGILPLIAGFAMLTPTAIKLFSRSIRPLLTKLFGITGTIASGSLITQISRTGIAIAALAIAVSASLGVGTMIGSFRESVVDWLTTRLRADIFISAPALVSRFNDGVIDTTLYYQVKNFKEVEYINIYRERKIAVAAESGDRGQLKTIHLIAANFAGDPKKRFTFIQGNGDSVWNNLLRRNEIIISEPFSYRNNKKLGDSLAIPTPNGDRHFRIAGVYRDYGSDMGFVMMELNTYRNYWNDHEITGIGIFIRKNFDKKETLNKLNALIKPDEEVIVQSNSQIIESSVLVFDRTFAVTNVLQILSIGVAFIGILASLMALQLERAKEFGIMRALGLLPGGLRRLVLLQTGLMGLVSFLLSVPLGNALALILIYVINKRSFGWTLDYRFSFDQLAIALILSVAAATLAGIYPAFKMSKTSPALAMREE